MRISGAVLLVGVLLATASSAQQDPIPSCKSSAECSQLAAEAIAQSEFEHAHDLAWRGMQLSPRNDTAVMYLLARTQSLSGRPHDALVMLRRLVDLGFQSDEIETHEDFRRVRSLPEWGDLLSALRAVNAASTAASEMSASARAKRVAGAGGSSGEKKPGSAGEKPEPSAIGTGAGAARAVPKGTSGDAPSASAREKPEPDVDETTPGLRVPLAPLALAYDSVSDRFVVLDESSDTLKVVDERTGNVLDLVSRGWSGAYRPVALAIDPRRGDLWAAGIDMTSGTARSALYKLQLVSGRLLQTIPLPDDIGPSRIVDLTIARDAIFILDALGRRVFSLSDGARSARVVANLATIPQPVSLAAASDTRIYIAYSKGLARLDLDGGARLPTPVPAAADIGDIESISWHDGSLFAVRRDGDGHTIARIQLDRRGTTATGLKPLGAAASRAAAVYGGVFYYVAADGDGHMILRGTRAR